MLFTMCLVPFTLGSIIAKIYDTDKVSAGLVAVASYIITHWWISIKTFELAGKHQLSKISNFRS